MEIFKEIYSTEGRINRLRYLKYMILLALAGAVAKFTTSCMATLLTGDPNGALVMTITLIPAVIAGTGTVVYNRFGAYLLPELTGGNFSWRYSKKFTRRKGG